MIMIIRILLFTAFFTAINGRKTKEPPLPSKRKKPRAFPLTRVRSYSGTEGVGGKAHSQLIRLGEIDYPDDGFGQMSGAKVREGPNPRVISNAVAAQSGSRPNARGLSSMVWAWGQFIDHDISLTEPNGIFGKAPIIISDESDILYNGPPHGEIPFNRSEYDPLTGTATVNPRQQINLITSRIDGSGVYGSDKMRADSLRTFMDGMMKMTLVSSKGNKVLDLLPRDGSGMFLAGDIRANEQVGLISMHTLFLREHNRLCREIKRWFRKLNPNDEQIYQLARKIVGAEIQAITYNEFLPALLGRRMALQEYKGYNETVDPSIATEFSTSAFRFGHSMLPPELPLYDKSRHIENISLRDAFFRPGFLVDRPINVDYLIGGFVRQFAQEIDNEIIDDVRNFLFGPPGRGGFDLAALNIQRGRDHGIPTYNKVRAAYNLPPKTEWRHVTRKEALQNKLASVYVDPDEMDAWVGGLCEDHVRGASVGELVGAALKDQFTRIRDGDPFFYLIDEDLQDFRVRSQIVDVDTVKLADIIRLNTQIENVNRNVFFVKD